MSFLLKKRIIRSLLLVVHLALIQWLFIAPLALADTNNSTGVELTSDLDINFAFQWHVKNIEKNNYSKVANDWGIISAPSGKYFLEFKATDGQWVSLRELQIDDNQITRIKIDSGVYLKPVNSITPNYWIVRDEAGKLITNVKKRWGFTALAPGSYSFEAYFPNQSFSIKQAFIVKPGELTRINVGTGVNFQSDLASEPPQRWQLKSTDTNITITNRWGVALVPPGDYTLSTVFANQSPISYKKVKVVEGKITPTKLDSAFKLRGKNLPEFYSLYDQDSRLSLRSKGTDTLFARPGQYLLRVNMAKQSAVDYQKVDVEADKITTAILDTGINMQYQGSQNLPLNTYIYSIDTNKKITDAREVSGFVPTPPGEYRIELAVKGQSKIEYQTLSVNSNLVTSLEVDTGIDVEAAPVFEKPIRWQLISVDDQQKTSSVSRRWGRALLPAGQYHLYLSLEDQPRVDYGTLDVVDGEISRITIDSGIEIIASNDDDKHRLLIYRNDKEKPVYISTLKSKVIALSPGKYSVIASSKNNYSWSSDIVVKKDEITTLTDDFIYLNNIGKAKVIESYDSVKGFNIAKHQFGGRIFGFSSQHKDSQWHAKNLIDGFDYLNNLHMHDRCQHTCGWLSKRDQLSPAEVTIGFFKSKEAVIDSIVIDNASINSGNKPDTMPRHVEVLFSKESADQGFSTVAEVVLEATHKPQVISLPSGLSANYIKLRVLSTYGSDQVSIGEISVIEDSQSQSILTDLEKDLARPENGGAIALFDSQAPGKHASQLIWQGDFFGPQPWHSFKSPVGKANYLPQDIVFGFHKNRVALIDSIVIDPSGLDLSMAKASGLASLAKEIVIEHSMESPVTGFSEISRVRLKPEEKQQRFKINKKARFIKIRVTEIQGQGHFVKIGKVAILESNKPGYESILRSNLTDSLSADSVTNSVALPSDHQESESNNTKSTANPLRYNKWLSGTISPLGEEDYYTLSLSKKSLITTNLVSQPFIQVLMSIYDSSGNNIFSFSPESLLASQKNFSLQLPVGDYFYKLSQAPSNIVLIWDTSGSMQGSEGDLKKAVTSFIDSTRVSEKLQLVKFSDGVKVLTTEFTNDVDQLKQAADNNFSANGSTRLYDAIAKGVELLSSSNGNKVIVVMSDGQDSASSLKYSDIWHTVKANNIRIYTLGLGEGLKKYNHQMGLSGQRFLDYLSLATYAKNFHADSSETLESLYQSVASELTNESKYSIKPSVSDEYGLLKIATRDRLLSTTTASYFELILDASGSMRSSKSRIDDRLKIDVAKEVLTDIVNKLPETSHLAFRVFGHRVREYDEGDCQDTELFYPLSQLKKEDLNNKITEVHVDNGTTPLSYSIVQAAKDLLNVKGEKHIILVTDGEEYCGAKPVDTVEKLLSAGIDVRIDIVGMDLKNIEVRQTMQDIATKTGGQFFNIKTSGKFEQAIQSVLGVKFIVKDAAGQVVSGGSINGSPTKLARGVYQIEILSNSTSVRVGEVVIEANQTSNIEIVKNGALVEQASSSLKKSTAGEWQSAQLESLKTSSPVQSPTINEMKALLINLEKKILEDRVNRPRP